MTDPPVKLSGTVTDERGNPIPGARITVMDGNVQPTVTDNLGRFTFNRLAQGPQVLVVYSLGFGPVTDTVICSPAEETIVSYRLNPAIEALNEVEIKAAQPEMLERLRTIRGTMLFAAKKNDVVRPDALVMNTGSNNARQLYAKVSGLNIWESDYGGNQLEIGGRGLSPSRTSNFNTRQNGYDISADPLGYPETYYSPPADAIERIDILRGASSLQFGSQFGGLVNFILKDKEGSGWINGETKQTVGSFGLVNSFNSVGLEKGKSKLYTFVNYRKTEGWKGSSASESTTLYGKYTLKAAPNFQLHVEYTHNQYLAQQPGGLTDQQFEADMYQVTRERNWFRVQWNLPALEFTWKIDDKTEVNHKTYALFATRDALGFLEAPNISDPANFSFSEDFQKQRNLIHDAFSNWGSETRILRRTSLGGKDLAFTGGFRFYQGNNQKQQGFASTGSNASFNYLSEDFPGISDFDFSNQNLAGFTEALLHLNTKTAITAGLRVEHIDTRGSGTFRQVVRGPANNIILDSTYQNQLQKERQFAIAGIGLSHRLKPTLELFLNFSQNYRSITFNDVVVRNPAFRIDPNISDERGYNLDLGLKGYVLPGVGVDITAFYLRYANRIGLLLASDPETFNVFRLRTNIGASDTYGVETLVELKPMQWFSKEKTDFNFTVFTNISLLNGRYNSEDPTIDGNKIELVPDFTFRGGVNLRYKDLKASLQYTYVNDHFSDATNAFETPNSISGIIPSYAVWDLGLDYTYRAWNLATGVNNLGNAKYFTRRATGYPGPGIIPANPRNVYVTVGYTF